MVVSDDDLSTGASKLNAPGPVPPLLLEDELLLPDEEDELLLLLLLLPEAELLDEELLDDELLRSPVPLRAILCGLVLSGLSVRVRVPVTALAAVGLNVTDTAQVLNSASVAPQLLAEIAKPLPLIALPRLIEADS